MLDKTKIRIIKDQVKNHINEHKTEYWTGSLFMIAGVTYVVTRSFGIQTIYMAPVFNNMPTFNNNNSNLVNFGGHMTKMVKRLSDDKIFEKVTEAAADAGCSVAKMSQHLNGHKDHVNNEIYKIVGIGTTG